MRGASSVPVSRGATELGAAALARAIRDRERTSEDVVEAYLMRIREVDPRLDAVVQLGEESAREEARRGLRRIPEGGAHLVVAL